MNDSSVLGGYFLGAIIAGIIAIWVAMDANKRGMNGIGWGIGVFLLCIVFLPIYLITRKPLLAQQQPYGYPPPPNSQPQQPYGYVPPPQPQPPQPPQQQPYTPPPTPQPQTPPPAAQPNRRFCSNCGSQLEGGVKFCPSCGKAV